MTTTEIISKFELLLDDTSELSSVEELALLNKVLDEIYNSNDWEFLKKSATGTVSATVPYVALPSDFSHFLENYQYTGNSSAFSGDSAPKVVFRGSNYNPFKIINWQDRRQYRNTDGYCYPDIANSRLYFTLQPTVAETYEFDYIYAPSALTAGQSPLIPARFQHALPHLMAVDDYIIQQFDKAKSYAGENKLIAKEIISNMKLWNSQFQLM